MANRGRGGYDLVLDSGDMQLPFKLAHEQGQPAVVPFDLGPGRVDEQVRNLDIPRVIDNLDGGMGFSRRVPSVPNGYDFALNGYTRAPGGIFCPAGKLTPIAMPSAASWGAFTINDSIRWGNTIYLLGGGSALLAIDIGATTARIVTTFAGGQGWAAGAIFNGFLYIGTSVGLFRINPAGAVTGPFGVPAAGNYLTRLRTVTWRPQGIPTQMLVGASYDANFSALRWCPITNDPAVPASWSAPVPIGPDRVYNIRDLAAAPRHIYAVRDDGVYDMDELGATSFNIARWMEAEPTPTAFGLHTGQGLYTNHARGLAYIPTSGEAQYVPVQAQPGWGLPYEGGVGGYPGAATFEDGWVVAGFSDGTQSYLCAGRPSDAAYGHATHVWHGAEGVVPDSISHVKTYPATAAAAGAPARLIATTDGALPGAATVRMYWQSLPGSGSPIREIIEGGPFQPADSASLFLPADAYDRPSAVATLLQIDMVTEKVTPTDTLRVLVAGDDGTYQDQGTAQDNGSYTSLMPWSTTSGRHIKARIDAVGHPILRALELRAALGYELREARIYRVVLAEDDGLRTAGRRENRDPEQRMLQLYGMLGRVIDLDDVQGRVRARVSQVFAGERRQLGSASREGAWAIVVPILVTILERPFRYDRADHYDTDRVWT